jgi:ATP-dependent Clp protease ATP-binding subunit ClpA
VRRDFGPAFVSRVGNPIIFDNFDRSAALEIARREALRLMISATGAAAAVLCDEMAALLIDEMPNFRDGARGVMEMIRQRLAAALRTRERFDGETVEAVLVDGRQIRIVGIGG